MNTALASTELYRSIQRLPKAVRDDMHKLHTARAILMQVLRQQDARNELESWQRLWARISINPGYSLKAPANLPKYVALKDLAWLCHRYGIERELVSSLLSRLSHAASANRFSVFEVYIMDAVSIMENLAKSFTDSKVIDEPTISYLGNRRMIAGMFRELRSIPVRVRS